MRPRFRFAICNEVFGGRPLRETCRAIRAAGYEGIEIAPFTLAGDPTTLPAPARRELRQTIEGEGLTFVGLHWLFAAPPGLHATTPDGPLRARTWDHLRRLIELCADLGDGGVMVFGSPKQRASTSRSTTAEARLRFVQGFASVAGEAEKRGVSLLVEAIPADQANDVVRTLDDAAEVVRAVASPAVALVFDTHNTADETESAAELIGRHFAQIRHVHLNEMDGRRPGAGAYDFRGALGALARHGYQGWLSVEVFDFQPDGDTTARESIQYLEGQIAQIL
jgi:D-psicose/D-tagatose/L-ribulose 3-epimerase